MMSAAYIPMLVLGFFGVMFLYASATYEHVLPIVPVVGVIWTATAVGSLLYFSLKR